MGNLALGIAPDFGAGALVVHAPIIGVGKLVEHEIPSFIDFLLGVFPGILNPLCRRRKHDLGAKGLHRLYPLQGGVVGHYQGNLQPEYPGNHSQGDAGVSAGRFN